MHRFSRIIPFLLWAATATQAWSQWTKEVGQRGFVQGTAFDISTVDSVDTVNGNVVLRVPLAALPAGHAGMGVGVTLTYNSGMYDGATAYFPADPPAYYSVGTRITLAGTGDANAVWGYGYNYGVYTELRDPQPAIVPGEVVGIYGNGCAPTQTGSVDVSQSTNSGLYPLRMRAVFPDGSTHVLVLMNPFMSTSDGWSSVASNGAIVGCFAGTNPQPPPVSLPLNYVTVDGTYVRVTIGGPNNPDGWFMQFPDGKSVKGVDLTTDTITDRNGNSVVIAHSDQSRACYPLKGDSSDSVITIKDTFGRCIQIENGLQANMAEWISQAAADGTTLVSKVNFGFVGIDYTYSYGPGSCQFAYQCTPTSDPGCAGTGTCTPVVQMMVTSVDLSQAGFTSPLSYSFAYNNNDTGC